MTDIIISCAQNNKAPFFFCCTHLRQILQLNCTHFKHKLTELNSKYINIKMVFSKELEMFRNHYQYIQIRSRSQLHSTLKLLHSKPLWACHGHPHKPLYKNRTTTLTHQTSLHLFFFFLTGTAVANPSLSLQA